LTFLKTISTENLTDKELVSLFKRNSDSKYVSELYQRYMELVFGVCLKYFKDAEKAKDGVMDIYESLSVKLKQHEVDNFKAWLSVVARNHCLMQLRSPRNLKTTELNTDFMQSVQQSHLKNEVLEKEESFKMLENCMDTLPKDQQQSIQLFYLEKKCYNEISEITGFEWSKVRSYIQNGKRNLKLCLEEKMIFTD